MTPPTLKAAFQSRTPITHRDITYTRILALRYEIADDGSTSITAELLDKSRNSVTRAKPEEIQEEQKC